MESPPERKLPRLTRRGAIALVAAPAAALLSRPVVAAAAVAGYAEEVRGQVTAELAAQPRALVPRGEVFLGDLVASADRSRAALRLGRGTSLRLGADTRVRIDRFIVDAGGVLTLDAGSLLLDKAADTPGTLQVRGSFGLITIRGTQAWVGPSNGVIGVFVAHGVAEVTSGGKSVVLQGGQGTNLAAPGAPPTAPASWAQARIRAALASVN